jgi:hypothetical protein
MNAELILGVVGTVGSGLAVLLSTLRLFRREKAEKNLIRHLKNYGDCRKLILEVKRGAPPEEYYLEILQYLERAREELAHTDQAMLTSALDQESLAGRRSYVKKLVEEARESLSSTGESQAP